MRLKELVLIAILLPSMAVIVPVMADAPGVGTVYEGVSVPGIALGFSRAEVEGAYGQPHYCTDHSIPDDLAYCNFTVSGGGLVSVRYRGIEGGFAHNSPDDEVDYIRWGEAVSGWTTTAGINTTLAKSDPDAVIAVYPEAEVTYTSFGLIQNVVDWLKGVEIIWSYDQYSTGHTSVSMSIFGPLPSLPTAQTTHVEDIELSAYDDRGLHRISGWAMILDEHERAATGAAVYASWTLPDGSNRSAVEDFVGIDGVAYFELITKVGRSYRGIYELRIDDVSLADHTFDPADSVLIVSVYLK